MYNGEMEKKVQNLLLAQLRSVKHFASSNMGVLATVQLIDVDMLNDPSTISTAPFSVLPNQRAPERGQDEGTVGGFSGFLTKKQDFKCSSTFTNLLSYCNFKGRALWGLPPGPFNLSKKNITAPVVSCFCLWGVTVLWLGLVMNEVIA